MPKPRAAACIGWRTDCRKCAVSARAIPRSGDHWIGLRSNGAYRVTALEQQKLLPQWAGAAARSWARCCWPGDLKGDRENFIPLTVEGRNPGRSPKLV